MQQRKPPAKRLYRPGFGGVGIIDAALDEKNQQEQKDREQDLALAQVQLKMELEDATKAMTNAQRQALLRKRRAQARLNAKLAVHRTVNEKQTADAIEKATDDAFDAALKDLHELNSKEGFSQEEWTEKISAIIEAFYPTKKSDKVPSMSQGSSMTDAPRGLGRLVTGGYNSTKIDRVSGVARRDHGGIEPWNGEGANRPVLPEGNGVDKNLQDGPQKKTFKVKLGEDEDYVLSAKQKELERLIGKHKVMLESMHKDEDAVRWKSGDPEARRRAQEEDTRMKLNFLERAAAGLIPSEIAERVVPLISRDLAAQETAVTG